MSSVSPGHPELRNLSAPLGSSIHLPCPVKLHQGFIRATAYPRVGSFYTCIRATAYPRVGSFYTCIRATAYPRVGSFYTTKLPNCSLFLGFDNSTETGLLNRPDHTVKPLITNISEEFIKRRLDNFSMSFILYYLNFSVCENK